MTNKEKLKKVEVETPLGVLTAQIGLDEDYPETYVYLRRPDGVEIDLCLAEIPKDGSGVKICVYNDTSREDYTHEFHLTPEEINVDMEEQR